MPLTGARKEVPPVAASGVAVNVKGDPVTFWNRT
jgi:hypothetical protein